MAIKNISKINQKKIDEIKKLIDKQTSIGNEIEYLRMKLGAVEAELSNKQMNYYDAVEKVNELKYFFWTELEKNEKNEKK